MTIVKRTIGGDGTFAFVHPTPAGSSLTTSQVAAHSSEALAAGTYVITEQVASG
jgi:hypothetical protein